MKKEVFSEKAPAPVGPYSQGIIAGGFLYISGQLPLGENGLMPTDIIAQSHNVMKNLLAVLQAAGLDFTHLVKTTVYLDDLADFTEFNAVYAEYLVKPFPARVCIQAAALPRGALVEVEAVALLP